MSAVDAPKRSPLPVFFARPLSLIWTGVLPQFVLLLLNLRAFDLIRGEMRQVQLQTAVTLFGMELILLAGVGALAWRLHRRKWEFSPGWAAVVLAAHAGYLWAAAGWGLTGLIPPSVSWWILESGDLIAWQFTFLMPALFHAALRLACFPVKFGRGADAGLTAAVGLAVPGAWFLLFQLVQLWLLHDFLPAALLMFLFFGSTLLVLLALIRLLAIVFENINLWHGRLSIALSLLVGVAAPLGGLLLNASIPFPVDFQDGRIYAMAVLNGFFLCLPPAPWPALQRALVLARCVFFAFTLYFFLVFLPYLPLALIAILAAGAGFLILTPTALFLVHLTRLAEDFRQEASRIGRMASAAVMGAAALVMPAWFTGEALYDRVTLDRAIRYVYEPDYRANPPSQVSPQALQRCLERLRDWKASEPLPYLSGFYGWIVFDNLVLPDDKMETLHRTFMGTGLEASESKSFQRPFDRRRGRAWRPRPAPLPPHDVRIAGLTQRAETDGPEEHWVVTLRLQNTGPGQSEWVGDIEVPEGIHVSGYWLQVGRERVPGRIFERKSAIWIYQMIRDVARRDPGLLVWTGPGRLELRVFPFAAGELRTTEIEFSAPTGWRPEVRIGGQAMRLGGDSPELPSLAICDAGEGRGALLASAAAGRLLPAVQREPYLHFIIDRSVGSPEPLKEALERCQAIAARFPRARDCMVSCANFEVFDLTNAPVACGSIGTFNPVAAQDRMPVRGGFCRDRALKHTLLRYHDRFRPADARSPWLLRYPIVVVVRQTTTPALKEEHLAWFSGLAPEQETYWVSDRASEIRPERFDGRAAQDTTPGGEGRPVRIVRIGGWNAVSAAGASMAFETEALSGEPGALVFDPASGAFREPVPAVGRMDSSGRFAHGELAWLENLSLLREPFRSRDELPNVTERARKSGTLTVSTAYIVVENSAQWKLLERTEKRKLRNAEALEMMESPEPSTWLLLGALLLLAAGRQWFTRGGEDR